MLGRVSDLMAVPTLPKILAWPTVNKLLVSFALTVSVYMFCPESQFSLITPVLIH